MVAGDLQPSGRNDLVEVSGVLVIGFLKSGLCWLPLEDKMSLDLPLLLWSQSISGNVLG